uniref:Adaptor protein ClpS core domain-containing protein n=1 Tax=Timspurckia oligopyrenoides TaxID=708627 RepID=A0A7S0ZJ21_9RHOD
MDSAFVPGALTIIPNGFSLGVSSNDNICSVLKSSFSQRTRGSRIGVSLSAVKAPEKQIVTPKRQVNDETNKGKMYRVYIIDDPFNTREYVISVLLEVVSGLTFSRAYDAMMSAHTRGQGLVVVVTQEVAEHYSSQIMNKGVLSMCVPDE